MKIFNVNKGSRLAQIIDKVHDLQHFQTLVNDYLPSPLDQHCQVANYQQGCLSLAVDSASWATQLRFLLPDLQAKLQSTQALRNLKRLDYLVLPQEQAPERQTLKTVPLSAVSRDILGQLAKSVSHAGLKRSLKTLTSHREET